MSRSKYRPKHDGRSGPPRWWRHLFTTLPLRAEARRLLHRCRPDAEPVLTEPNRLREYYW